MQAYGRMIFGMLRIIALSRSRESLRVPCSVYIDEFQNFISSDLEAALNQLRKFGFFLVLAHQYPAQSGISASLQRALFSCGVRIMGQNEYGTLRRIEQQI